MAEEENKPGRRADAERVGLGALIVLVVGLGATVWLALPKDGDPSSAGDASAAPALDLPGAALDASEGKSTGALERLPEATCELAVLTDKPEAEVASIATADAIAKSLDSPHCGGTCDALRAAMADRDRFEIEITRSEDYILPPSESYETVAPGLTPAERATIGTRPTAVVIRSRGPSNVDQLPARVAFAATAAVAGALSGLVYDEVVRRIETPAQFAQRVITAPLGQNVFTPRQIAIQLYRQEDGTARLLTLGMARFGSPDFTMRGAGMEAGASLANVMNAAAGWAAGGKTALPIVVTLDDVARVSGQAPGALAKDPIASTPVRLDAIDADRTEGDPDNEMQELVPVGGATPQSWGAVVTELFGEAPKVVFVTDKELDAIAARARRDLPGAVKRFEAGEGALFVKGPFPIPEASRLDGGAKDEWMWIEVSSCDAKGCAGALSNSPGYATNLAAGRAVVVAKDKAADWVLRLRDGGSVGGESIRALERRAK